MALASLCMGLLFGVAPVHAAAPLPPVNLLDQAHVVALAGHGQFVVDQGGRLKADDIEARQAELPFMARPSGYRVLLADGDALWFRFSARNPAPEDHWQLEVDLPGVNDVMLHYRNAAGQWVVQRAGDSLPQSLWPQRGRKPLLALSGESGREVTYFLRIRHDRVPFSGRLFLKTQTVAAEQELRAMFLLGAYFGLAALAIFVALANSLAYEDRGFSTYVIYIGTMVLGQAGMTGVGGMLLWPEWPSLNDPMTFFVPVFAGATGVWFVRAIATPRQYSTLLDRMAIGIIVALMAVVAFDVFVPTAVGFDLSMNLLTLSLLLVMVLLVLAIIRGDRHSRWIAAGFVLVVAGGAFPVARNFGLISSGFLSEYGLMLGSALEMPLIFYGLSRRLNEQNESRARARALSVTDPLTGLTSERKLITQLQASLERARTTGRPLAMMVVELVNHPTLAREHGREGADRALVLAATRLKAVVRDIDTVARVGNQHFAVLMESPCTQEEANAMATHVVAQGLRSSDVLPDGALLRFHVALSILPMAEFDARGTLQRLLQELRLFSSDARKTIRMVRA